MFALVSAACATWLALLVAVLVVAASRAGSLLARLLWVDTLALALIAWLALVAYLRAAPEYLDAALVLGLLAFAGTLAGARYHRGRPLLP